MADPIVPGLSERMARPMSSSMPEVANSKAQGAGFAKAATFSQAGKSEQMVDPNSFGGKGEGKAASNPNDAGGAPADSGATFGGDARDSANYG